MMPSGDNVVPLRRRQDPADADLPVPLRELAETVDAIGYCLSQIAAVAESGQGFDTQILLHITALEQRFEDLAAITVVTWPDVSWALRFCSARVRAVTAIAQSVGYFTASQSNTWSARALAYSGPLSRALREVRDLIIQRYPQTRQAC
jgi:hypothetical protein